MDIDVGRRQEFELGYALFHGRSQWGDRWSLRHHHPGREVTDDVIGSGRAIADARPPESWCDRAAMTAGRTSEWLAGAVCFGRFFLRQTTRGGVPRRVAAPTSPDRQCGFSLASTPGD